MIIYENKYEPFLNKYIMVSTKARKARQSLDSNFSLQLEGVLTNIYEDSIIIESNKSLFLIFNDSIDFIKLTKN